MKDGQIPLEYHQKPWGLRPDALRLVTRALAGELSAEELEQLGDRQAANGLDDDSTRGGVAVIPLRGILTPKPSFISLLFGGGGGLQGFRRQLRQAVSDDAISSILINVDSPGGSTDLIAETAADVRNARGEKPIVAIANTMAASAAYWIASQADEIVVTPSGEVGSIGVFILHEEFSEMDKRIGIATTLISAGRFKTEGNPYEPLTEEGQEEFQRVVDEYYGMFVADVAKGRGVAAGDVRGPDFGEGRMLSAKRAVKSGMADRVATFEETAQRLARGGSSRRRSSEADLEHEVEPDTSTEATPIPARGVRALQLAARFPEPDRL